MAYGLLFKGNTFTRSHEFLLIASLHSGARLLNLPYVRPHKEIDMNMRLKTMFLALPAAGLLGIAPLSFADDEHREHRAEHQDLNAEHRAQHGDIKTEHKEQHQD